MQVETWSAMVEEGKELFPLHWKEIAVFQDKYQMCMDYARYAALEQANMIHVITVRDGSKLVGYTICFVMPHMHYKDAGAMAYTDMYFILPEYRKGCGARMFMELARSLKERGVVNVMTSCKVHFDHTEMLEKLGWEWVDKTFWKYLGDN